MFLPNLRPVQHKVILTNLPQLWQVVIIERRRFERFLQTFLFVSYKFLISIHLNVSVKFLFSIKNFEQAIYDLDWNKKNKLVDILWGSWLVQFNVFL